MDKKTEEAHTEQVFFEIPSYRGWGRYDYVDFILLQRWALDTFPKFDSSFSIVRYRLIDGFRVSRFYTRLIDSLIITVQYKTSGLILIIGKSIPVLDGPL
jgi:hypothetical protein